MEDEHTEDITNENDLVLATEDESFDRSSHLDGTIEDHRASMQLFMASDDADHQRATVKYQNAFGSSIGQMGNLPTFSKSLVSANKRPSKAKAPMR